MRQKVKNNWIRKVIAFALVAVTILLNVSYLVNAADDTVLDVAEYKGNKTESDWTYPTQNGKVFAGWYTDNTYTTPYTSTTGEAYAKFVDANVLSVAKQLKTNTISDSSETNIRFLTSS